MSDVTQLLEAANRGDQQAAAELLPLVYDELRKLAAARLAREKPGQTLNATALVHEAYLRLVGEQQFDGRGHFFAAAAEAIRRILVEQARRWQAIKHGAHQRRAVDPDELAAPVPDEELLALNEALDQLAAEHPQKALFPAEVITFFCAFVSGIWIRDRRKQKRIWLATDSLQASLHERANVSKLASKPGAGESPVAVGSARRDAQDIRGSSAVRPAK